MIVVAVFAEHPENIHLSCTQFNFSGDERTTYEDVKTIIYRRLGISPTQHSIQISARYTFVVGAEYEVSLIPVGDEIEWRMIYQTVVLETNKRILELVVNVYHVDFLPDKTFLSLGMPSDTNMHEDDEYSEQFLPRHSEHEIQTNEVPEEEEDDEYAGLPLQEESWATGEDYSDSANEDEPEYDVMSNGNNRLVVIGRSEKEHPARWLSDASEFNNLGVTKPIRQFENPLAVNRTFKTKQLLIEAINDYHVTKNIQIITIDSSKKKLVVKCRDSNCQWRLYARPTKGNVCWEIVTNSDEHTCHADLARSDHKQLTAKVIAGIIRRDVQENPSLTIQNVRGLVRARYRHITPSYAKLWRGREEAIAQLFGSWEGSYALLPRIFRAIQERNPGTKFKIVTMPTNDQSREYFKCAAWAWGPCIEAIKWLRPVISIDAAFLSGRYQGRLLMVCGYDAENRVLPLAFGLVEKEELATWGWFMKWVRQEVIGNGKICVISDRHKGIKAIFEYPQYGWSEEAGVAIHRYCMQHVAENFYKACKNKDAVHLFKRLASKKKPRRFDEGIAIMKQQYREGYDYLVKCGKKLEEDKDERPKPSRWAQSHDGGYRWGIMTSNGSESLNRVFKDERRLPVLAIVEGTWYKCVKWFDERRMEAQMLLDHGYNWSKKVTEVLDKRNNKSTMFHVFSYDSEQGMFEVHVAGERIPHGCFQDFKYIVTLQEGQVASCDCKKPNLTGLPCSHVIACCRIMNYDVNQFVHKLYSAKTLKQTWSAQFKPYSNQEDWPEYNGPKIVPERRLVQMGRRKHVRIPMLMDEMQGRRVKSQRRGCNNTQSGRHSVSIAPTFDNRIGESMSGLSASQHRIEAGRHSISGPPAMASTSIFPSRSNANTSSSRQPQKSLGNRIVSFLKGSSSRGRN